MKIDEMITANT